MLRLVAVSCSVAMAVSVTAAVAQDETRRDGAAGDKAPTLLERLKQKVIGDAPDRERNPVKAAQRALQERGYDPGPVDGRIGAKTQNAVKRFQKDQGLRATGRLDAETVDRLRARDARRAASPSATPREGRGRAGGAPGGRDGAPGGRDGAPGPRMSSGVLATERDKDAAIARR
jgi:peptidoglycan hydrolase-like protein with peptidoglycan-binding domain